MHGVRRSTETINTKELEKQRHQGQEELAQINYYRGLEQRVLELKASDVFDPQLVLQVTADLLQLNTDWMTAWNLRKRALLKSWEEQSKPHLIDELEFSVLIIKTNPKCYGAWYHRYWLVKEIKRREWPFDLASELKLTAKLLDLDSRNFHGWNYRWYLYQTWSLDPRDEFHFTTQMIYKNFSNYSAWHRRSTLLPLLPHHEIILQVRDDLDLIKSAYFTEPQDQSCWFYLRWLCEFAIEQKLYEPGQLFKEQIDSIDELLTVEPDCSLALAAWLHFAKRLDLSPEAIKKRVTHLVRIDPLRQGLWRLYYPLNL